MKIKLTHRSLLVAAITLSSFAVSAQMDSGSRDLLIDKLSQVNMSLAPNDSSKVSVTLRLADLLAERARVNSMAELEQGCTTCTAGQKDREKAIRLYRDVLDRVPAANRGKVMIQLGHLYQMTGNETEARSFYGKIANEAQDPNARAEASLSLAEMSFKKNQFAEARKGYQEVLKIPTASSRGLAAYRSAWSSFNLGDINGATQELITILKTPALLTRTGVASNQIDPQFKEEVSRDLATFLSKKNLEKADVEQLFTLSPENTRVSNVTLLAAEAERVGRKKEALMVWNFVYGHQSAPAERLEVLLHRAPLLLETGARDLALQDMESATALWKELKGCGKADCGESQKLYRQFIVVWNQAEKKAPTAELSKAYGLYLEAIPNDVEMNLWGAQVARELKDWKTAMARQEAAVAAIKTQKPDAKTAGSTDDKLEVALLTNIENAEASGDDALLMRAQDLYVKETRKGTKTFEVSYQKAKRLYDQNQYALASEEMRKLALDPKGNKAVRKQAADLSLDALGMLKDEDKMIAWSKDYAGAFKDNALEFNQVGQKALLSRSAALAPNDPAAALAVLGQFNAREASASDRVIYLKNKLILAEKTRQFDVARNAADDLLAQKDLKPEDREFALGRKAWLSELKLDFAGAYTATSQMQLKDQAPEQKTLKLAIYADLAGQNPMPLYQQYIKTTKDPEARQAVASEIVRRSNDPVKEIQAQKSILDQAPDLLARLYTEAYSKTPTDQILKKASSDTKVQNTNWGRLLTRVQLLKEYNAQKAKLAGMQIDSKNQKTLGKSIKDRAAELTKAEKMAAGAIQSGDWTSQLVTIDLVARESDRFYQELMSLPMPEGLKPEEEQEYMQILSQQASPFKIKAEQAQSKVKEFWSGSNWKADLEKSVQEGAEFRTLIAQELAALKVAAPEADQAFFAGLEAKNSQSVLGLPDVKELQAAREAVRQSPLDRSAANRLLELEKKSKNFAMVQYLEGRLKSLPTAEPVQEVKQ
ncbi:MAG: hypothetical protein KF681_03600 [Bdellovibrionaceae bacterium]|nr:hypothetical protein [Pseudobdellovibrionaceae bacterium]